MPTLSRYAVFLAVAGALVFGTMVALATLVTPSEREIIVRIDKDRINK